MLAVALDVSATGGFVDVAAMVVAHTICDGPAGLSVPISLATWGLEGEGGSFIVAVAVAVAVGVVVIFHPAIRIKI